MKKLILVIGILIVVAISLIYWYYPKDNGVPTGDTVIIRQAGGSALLIKECSDKNYVGNISDYIIIGTVEKVESRQSEGKIFTYSDILIDKYEKGVPFQTNKIQIITPGGTVGDITQTVEDQPTLHKGKNVKLYIRQNSGELSISCGIMGVDEIK